MFDEFMNDEVTLVKQNGDRFDNITANVQSNMIFINNTEIPIEEGDKLLRKLPNGLIENYIVDDSGYHSQFEDFPAHYQIKVHKETCLNNRTKADINYIINAPIYGGMQIGGNNNFQNNNITNQSINNDIEKLSEIIKNSLISELEKEDIEEYLDRIVKLSKQEKSTETIERVNSRLGNIVAILKNSALVYQQAQPLLENIKHYFNI